MDAEDNGHRYGNFPNYYTFHPPQNRLQVLDQTNILSYIRDGLKLSDEEFSRMRCAGGEASHSAGVDAGGSGKCGRKKPRLESNAQASSKNDTALQEMYYCDLGCNEGDLTTSMAASLHSSGAAINNKEDELSSREETTTQNAITTSNKSIQCLGLDIDSMLIERANTKFVLTEKNDGCSDGSNNEAVLKKDKARDTGGINKSKSQVSATFNVCNLCSEEEHSAAYNSFWNEIDGHTTSNDVTDPKEETEGKGEGHCKSMITKKRQQFHLTTIFSTTMWIHVHGGDVGLRQFLERACNATSRFLLIEPQPSGW